MITRAYGLAEDVARLRPCFSRPVPGPQWHCRARLVRFDHNKTAGDVYLSVSDCSAIHVFNYFNPACLKLLLLVKKEKFPLPAAKSRHRRQNAIRGG